MDVKEGHSIVVSKTVRVIRVNGNVVTGDDGTMKRNYILTDWSWEFATPIDWPAMPGDVWEIGRTRFAAMDRGHGVVLEPMNSDTHRTYYPEDHERFLSQHPVLVSRG